MEGVSSKDVARWIRSKLWNYCPLEHGQSFDKMRNLAVALELWFALKEEEAIKLGGRTVLDFSRKSDRKEAMEWSRIILDGVEF